MYNFQKSATNHEKDFSQRKLQKCDEKWRPRVTDLKYLDIIIINLLVNARAYDLNKFFPSKFHVFNVEKVHLNLHSPLYTSLVLLS